MRERRCCVLKCNNSRTNSENIKFYTFPRAWHKQKQRELWINAVNRRNPDGSKWEPGHHHEICSSHFIGNAKSSNEHSPSYIPRIFPHTKLKINEEASVKRFERFMELRNIKTNAEQTLNIKKAEEYAGTVEVEIEEQKFCTQECEVNFLPSVTESSKTFICNRYIVNNVCDAEVQTEINEIPPKIIIPKRRRVSDKICGTPIKKYEDKKVGTSNDDSDLKRKGFLGIESIKNDEQLIDLGGVTLKTFKLFAKKLIPPIENCKVSKENRLLIFFIKLKTGLTYSALSVLFQVHRTTISRIFNDTLQYVASALRNGIKWLDKDTVQGLMPECFKPKYSNTRVILDCTEFPIEIPSGIDNRVYTYSHYKKGFTAKVLIGCSPNGSITFKSPCAGGRKSDSQITIESGLLDLLEDGDVVLADKGFPEIKTKIADNGKKVMIVMPPFLTNPEFTKKEIDETYSVANVRIHIERIMQRIKIFNILNKIPAHLFHCIDDIIHVICILVNLQPPIIDEETNKVKEKQLNKL